MELLGIMPLPPLAGALVLALLGARLPRTAVSWIGVGSVGLSMAVSVTLAALLASSAGGGFVLSQTYWTWMSVGGFNPAISFYLDPVSLVFTLIITVVGFLIHLYSVEFMASEEGYSRFFAYMNLFVASMLVLVLAGDLLFLYLGWEGVGLCSYLLIGFWYREPANGLAARKAFIVTRVGDTAMALGLFLLLKSFQTLDITRVLQLVPGAGPGSGLLALAAALILVGAIGKSAQLPLQTWLPDAMAGPTPVSALIHAATMVTAGVYLVVRLHPLFIQAPDVMRAIAAIGALTLVMAGMSALVQTNIKRVLAYSTISQIGYMFLALGCGAWSAALFHFVTHAFFKALLFLGAGAVIIALNHEHDMTRMGGLRTRLPVAFWTFLAGGASLSALPLVTAGFYSKDLILSRVFHAANGGPLLWGAGIFGAFLTALYTFRMIFMTFFGEQKSDVMFVPRRIMNLPLVVLAAFALAAGFIEMPPEIAKVALFSGFLEAVFPRQAEGTAGPGVEAALIAAGAAASLLGVACAYVMHRFASRSGRRRSPARVLDAPRRFLLGGWGFDRLYDLVFVRPLEWIARINRDDVFDLPGRGIAAINVATGRLIGLTQTGVLRWYIGALLLGAIILIIMAVVL